MIYKFISSERYTETSTIVKFMLEGRETMIVRPDKPLPGNPTVWRTEFFEAFNMVDKALLEKGWHLCYHKCSDMYGCPESLVMFKEFYEFAKQTFNLSAKPVMFGFSRGGLYAVNYAAEYPNDVGGLYLDAPVTNISDWPCRYDPEENEDSRDCLAVYGLTKETLPSFDKNPNDKVHLVAHLPIIVVAGLIDETVVWEKNGARFVKKLEELNSNHKVILKPDCDHHPHSLEDPTPVVEFLEANCL